MQIYYTYAVCEQFFSSMLIVHFDEGKSDQIALMYLCLFQWNAFVATNAVRNSWMLQLLHDWANEWMDERRTVARKTLSHIAKLPEWCVGVLTCSLSCLCLHNNAQPLFFAFQKYSYMRNQMWFFSSPRERSLAAISIHQISLLHYYYYD